jgi:hypothetical protein
MKYLSLLPVIFLTIILSYSQEIPTGFQDFDFGTNYNVMKNEMIDKYHLTQSTYLEYSYSGDYNVYFYKEYFHVSNFKLGNKPVDLFLYFNKNQKFYKFEFACRNYTANYFDTKLKEDAQFLSEIFEKKYGPPKHKYTPDFFDVREGYYSFYWKWWRQRHTIFTALSTHESEYHASAVVYDDILEKEHQIIEENNKKDEIEKAVDAF